MTDRIRTLVKRIAETRPVQGTRRQTLLSDLRTLRGDLNENAASEQSRSLDAAILLLEFMGRAEEVATADTFQIVASLVGMVDERSLRASTPGAPAPRAPTPSSPGHAQASALWAQTSRAAVEDVTQHHDLRLTHEFLLGSILLHAGVISPDSLARGLQLHTSSGMALGLCLVQLGAATPEQIAGAVAYQDRLREQERTTRAGSERPAEPQAPARPVEVHTPGRAELRMSAKQQGFVQSVHAQVLGEILIRLGSVTREQLDRALQLQRAASVHIGQALVESGAASWEQVKKALEVQRQLRSQRRAS